MYKMYNCMVLTKKYNYYFEIIAENSDEAESKSINYVTKQCNDNELIGGSSSEQKGAFSEKSLKLIEQEADEKPDGI